MNIGFFDSGVGGATILKEALKDINGSFYYFADNNNAPYGTKDEIQVKKYSFNAIDLLVKKGCNIIVVACNTATSVAIRELREKYPHITIIGTEPAIKVAQNFSKGKKILVVATSITVKGEKLLNLVDKLLMKNYVDVLALDKLVEFAENGNVKEEEINRYLKNKLKDYDLNNYSHIVLGCTHFPLFRKNFKSIVPSNVQILDSCNGVVNNLKKKLLLLNPKYNEEDQEINLLLSKKESNFVTNFKNIIQKENINIEII